jgi:predicted PurR-regulated permease PerM
MNKFNITLALSITALAVFTLLLFKFWLVAANIAGGFLLYFIIDSFLEFLERKGIRGFFAYTVLALVSATAITSFILFVSIPLVEQTKELAVQLPQLTEQVHQKVMEFSDTFPFLVDAQEAAKEKLLATGKAVFSISKEIVTSVLTIIFIALILIASRGTLHQTFTEKIPNDYFETTVGLTHRIVEHVKSYTVAKILETVIMMAIYFIGFWAIGLPHTLLLSIIGGLLNIIPYIGPLITIVPIGIVAMLEGGYPLLALSAMIIGIAQLIDNAVLQTMIISKFVDMHPLTVVLITIIAGKVAGVAGMIIAIPVYAVTKIVVGGLYDYLKSVQRHEKILRDEERYQKSYAGKRKIKTHAFSMH